MQIIETAITDVKIIEPRVFRDARGFFHENWNVERFAAIGLDLVFVQDNHSRSGRHTLRGLHYQHQYPQGKLVRVVRGAVFDVAVDMRRSSPTFGRWVGVVLDDEQCRQLWVPPGFAHGFLTLSETADFVYKCTDFYHPEDEHTIRWDDAEIGIEWPIADPSEIQVSAKDAAGIAFAGAVTF
ncbi:MAG: dTDP-4-dehydrorhamnose 3,5-epimerase [Thioalkalivibrionaceae bacterium]